MLLFTGIHVDETMETNTHSSYYYTSLNSSILVNMSREDDRLYFAL